MSARQLGCGLSRHEAAEVYLAEELRHAETNPTCEISRKLLHVTLKFETKILCSDIFAQVNLISAAPNAPKFEGSQEETEWQEQGAREASVEAGQKCIKLEGARKSNILLTFGKIGACLHQFLNLRNENLLSTPVRQCI